MTHSPPASPPPELPPATAAPAAGLAADSSPRPSTSAPAPRAALGLAAAGGVGALLLTAFARPGEDATDASDASVDRVVRRAVRPSGQDAVSQVARSSGWRGAVSTALGGLAGEATTLGAGALAAAAVGRRRGWRPALPVLAEGAAPAALVLAGEARDPFTALDESFLRALGQQVGAALHSAALYRALQERRAELERLSLRMVRQHEDERRRLSRELHDETAQVFTAVKMQLGMLRDGAAGAPSGDARWRARLERVMALIDTGIGSIRAVTHDLRPSLLDDIGLLPALRSLCADFEERTGIAVTLEFPPSLPDVPEDTDLALFRALQEGLSNVARHAGARRVRVMLRADGDGALCLAVRDDGAGLGGGVDLARWEREGHMGLVGMRERIAALGGSVTLAGAEDGGAELRVRVPAAPDAVAGEAAITRARP